MTIAIAASDRFTETEMFAMFNIDMTLIGEGAMDEKQVRDRNRFLWDTKPVSKTKLASIEQAEKDNRLVAHAERINKNLAKIEADKSAELDEPVQLGDFANLLAQRDLEI